jgi:hypothetical protein
MALPVLLREVVEELQTNNESFRSYINRKTGELVPVNLENASLVESGEPLDDYELKQWEREELEEVERVLFSGDYIPLPSQFEIHEWSIMQRFTQSLQDEDDREKLSHAIHGRGAFRHFKHTVDRLGLREEWFSFRDEALAETAIEFLERHGIPYRR